VNYEDSNRADFKKYFETMVFHEYKEDRKAKWQGIVAWFFLFLSVC